jgi:Malectin domain/Glycosyl hydrolase family 67 N-terminus
VQGTRVTPVRTGAVCAIVAACAALLVAPAGATAKQAEIVVGREGTRLERLAARELQRFLSDLTGARLSIVDDDGDRGRPEPQIIVGRPETNEAIARLVAAGELPEALPDQAFALRTVTVRGRRSIAVLGGDDAGSLYGAYDLLERYGARFYIDRDVLPEAKRRFEIESVDVVRRPAQEVRGLLPWHDFLNGPSGYSYEDFKHYVDQMVKQKLNTLIVHNYSGAYPDADINEPFMNFECRGTGHGGFLDTSVSNQRWGLATTRARDMAFGAGRLLPFDVLGSDAARYTDEQPDAQRNIFLKAKAMMQQVIRYAQSREMEVVMATDLDELPRAIDEAGCTWHDEDVLRARIDDILQTYPTLRNIQLYIGESSGATTPQVIEALRFVHAYLAEKRPGARLITGGWFQEQRMPEMDRELPEDIIFSMLLPHDMTVRPEWEQLSPGRERWPIPWMEFDGGLSEPQFAVGRMQEVLPQFRAMGVEGMVGILWRTRAAATNVGYFAQDSWQPEGEALDRRAFYRDFAARSFGPDLADAGADALEAVEATGYPKFATAEYVGPERPPGWNLCGCAAAADTAAAHGAIEQRFEAMKARARDRSSRANLDYFAQFMRWMRAFWTTQHTVPAAAAKAQPKGDIRINVGGGASADLGPDTGYESGNTYTTTGTVANDFGYQEAIRSERWADARPLVYGFEAPAGTYRVELFFQEGYFGYVVPGDPVGLRVFDVEIEGQVLADDFDIAAAAGGSLRGVRLAYDVPVTDGRLDIRFVNEVSNPKVDIIKAFRVDDDGNPLPPVPGDAAGGWEDLKRSGFQESIEAYQGMAGSLPSLGGLVSAAGGRWYPAYREFERAVTEQLPVEPPQHVVAEGSPAGAEVTWRGAGVGYDVYRAPAEGGEFAKLNDEPLTGTRYFDRADGSFRYAVRAIAADGAVSPLSLPARVAAGRADHAAPRVFSIPENLQAVAGEPLRVPATAVDDRAAEHLEATLRYRDGGDRRWRSVEMRPNVLGQPATFYADVPPRGEGTVEYYVRVSDGRNAGYWPAAGREQPLSATVAEASGPRPGPVRDLDAGSLVTWSAAAGDVHTYEIYRGTSPHFPADSAHYLTYVPAQQHVFRDVDVEPGRRYYYRVLARSISERSGPVSRAVARE